MAPDRLPSALRKTLERAFDACFCRVRLDYCPQLRLFGVRAAARGDHVLISRDSPLPVCLLAHELAHVLQQRAGRVPPGWCDSLALEDEANSMAEAFMAGNSFTHPYRGLSGRPSVDSIQPYNEDPRFPGVRTSNTGHTVVRGKLLFTTPELLEAANRELHRGNARVRLRFDPASTFRGLCAARPIWIPEGHPGSYHRTLNDQNIPCDDGAPPPALYVTWTDCHRNSQTVMGAYPLESPYETERPMLGVGDARRPIPVPALAQTESSMAGFGDLANRGAFAVLKVLSGAAIPADAQGIAVPVPASANDVRALFRSYTDRYPNPSAADFEARQNETADWERHNGINAFVRPEVREGLCVMPNKGDGRFSSPATWTNLESRVGAPLLARIGLTAASTYEAIDKTLAELPFDSRLTPDERMFIENELIRTHMGEKLLEHRGDEPDAPPSARRQQWRDMLFDNRPLTELFNGFNADDIVYLLKHKILEIDLNGHVRDNLNTDNLIEQFNKGCDDVVTLNLQKHLRAAQAANAQTMERLEDAAARDLISTRIAELPRTDANSATRAAITAKLGGRQALSEVYSTFTDAESAILRGLNLGDYPTVISRAKTTLGAVRDRTPYVAASARDKILKNLLIRCKQDSVIDFAKYIGFTAGELPEIFTPESIEDLQQQLVPAPSASAAAAAAVTSVTAAAVPSTTAASGPSTTAASGPRLPPRGTASNWRTRAPAAPDPDATRDLALNFFGGRLAHGQDTQFRAARDNDRYGQVLKSKMYALYSGFPAGRLPEQNGQNWLRIVRMKATATWKNVWNFHWAGVVLVDGQDYVTLENLSVEAPEYPKESWYFAMYRRIDTLDEYSVEATRRQSFHEQSLATGSFGNRAITLSYRFFEDAPPPVAVRERDGGPGTVTLVRPARAPEGTPSGAGAAGVSSGALDV
jgi:hypothetical protein